MKPIDEVQLTAYALGELSAAERAGIEAWLRDHPEQRAAVEDIRALAGQLAADLQHEPELALTDEQRRRILQPPAPRGDSRVRFPWRTVTGFAAVAAVITLVFGGAFWGASRHLHGMLLARMGENGEVAMNNPADTTAIELDTEPMAAEATPSELPEMVDYAAAPIDEKPGQVEMEVQDFSAPPRLKELDDLQTIPAACAPPPPPMKARASVQLGDRAGAGRTATFSSYGGNWNTFRQPPPPPNTESYAQIQGNTFKQVADEPLSTFSIDVDTASYANLRRFLRAGQLPPPDAVRIEEMVNYFAYDYAPPKDDTPFAVHVESAACPWNPAHPLVQIGLKGKTLDAESRPPCNLVFLLDVSGSMSDENKLPLVKKSIQLLARQLTARDRVSIVVYAGAAGLVLPPTSGSDLDTIDHAVAGLAAGGSTAGGEGIRLAYDEALENLLPGGNNRVILCTDGDFNVGITDSKELAAFIADRAKKGIFLTVLGFGMGNYKDDRLETLADKGNGNYAYIDSFSEARKNLAEQAVGTLFTIAKDVKLQVEFNPARIAAYRLVGYENRLLAKEDFNNDQKDAGELGAGHTVTAFYELVPVGGESAPGVDPLKYQPAADQPARRTGPADASSEWLTVKLRYKLPKENRSIKREVPFTGSTTAFENASADFRFAAGVAAGGLLLRQDPAASTLTYPEVIQWTSAATGADPDGYRREFLDLLKNAAIFAH